MSDDTMYVPPAPRFEYVLSADGKPRVRIDGKDITNAVEKLRINAGPGLLHRVELTMSFHRALKRDE